METAHDTPAPSLPLDPIWRQAALDALQTFAYGDIIPHEWLNEHLDIQEPEGRITVEEYRLHAFELLRKVDGFRNELLTQHQRYLVNVRGIGYKIIEPPHQTEAAMCKLQKDLRRTISQAMAALVHINDTALSLDDARENADAKAKLAALRMLHVNQLAAP